MKFESMSSRILSVSLLLILLFGFFRVVAPHLMKNKESIISSAETAGISELQFDTAISITRLPSGFYKVKKFSTSSLDEKGYKKISVYIQSVKGLSKEQLFDSTGTILKIYWYQPISNIEPDYGPGDVIERPRNKPLEAICHPGIARF